MALVHELSWSVSRAGTFETCRRQYFYAYYLSWRGWEKDSPEERQKAYILKAMARMPMLAGGIIHDAIHRCLWNSASGRPSERERLIEWALKQLRNGYKTSRDGHWRARPSELVHLAEHYYAEPRIDESTDAAKQYGTRYAQRIRDCIQTFFESTDPMLQAVRAADPSKYIRIEPMTTFTLDWTKVFAVPDFACRDNAGRVHIFDWKTGKPSEKDRFQLATYALFACELWNADAAEIDCCNAYLLNDEVQPRSFTEADLAEAKESIRQSIGEMKAVHFNADTDAGNIDDFPMIEDDSPLRRECDRCNFRELCGRA